MSYAMCFMSKLFLPNCSGGRRLLRVSALVPVMLTALVLTAQVLIALQALAPSAAAKGQELPGTNRRGEVLLPNGWRLHAAGTRVEMLNLPENLALSPDGQWLAVLHAGYGPQEVDLVDLKSNEVVARAPVHSAFYGLAFSADGALLYASGGDDAVVHVFAVKNRTLQELPALPLAAAAGSVLVGGVAVDTQHQVVYAAATFGDALQILDGRTSAQNPVPAAAIVTLPAQSFPYTPLLSTNAERIYVSLWGASSVSVVDAATQKVVATWATESHPTEMALSPRGDRLYVACANSKVVVVLSTVAGQIMEKISTALFPDGPSGNTPGSLTLTPDGKMLLVANADANNIAVFSVGGAATVPLGFIPVDWYPTAVRYAPRVRRIYVASGKGAHSLANPKGPSPFDKTPSSKNPQYVAQLLNGDLNVIDFPTPKKLHEYTERVFALSPERQAKTHQEAYAERLPIPRATTGGSKEAGQSPIKHVFYVIKENRTYDQLLGDVKAGNGEPNLCIFPQKITPNQHQLASEFVLLDNFYADGEVSANGHEWSMAAYATDFVEKMWPLNYRGTKPVQYPAEGSYDSIAHPAGGYLWDKAAEKGLTYISLGEFVHSDDADPMKSVASVATLAGHIDPAYPGFNMDIKDQSRAEQFIADLHHWDELGTLPALTIVRLPNDHTQGTRAGKPTPTAYVADNDLALGRIIEAISQSKYWRESAVFVVEDDAQNGADHVDAHRTVAFIASPYAKRHHHDSTMYTTSSILRTIELILGLPPMSQFDAAAKPLYGSFQARADARPFLHATPDTDLNAVNTAASFGAHESEQMAFKGADVNDPAVLNDIIWRSVRGPMAVQPAPVHAAFFVPHIDRDEDDEEEDDDGGTGRVGQDGEDDDDD